jgi:hypothetical protein
MEENENGRRLKPLSQQAQVENPVRSRAPELPVRGFSFIMIRLFGSAGWMM